MITDRCPYCESKYSDERDKDGQPYCECDGAEIARLTKENGELKAKVSHLEEVIALARLGIPVSWIPKLIEQRERELKEGKTQRPLEIDNAHKPYTG